MKLSALLLAFSVLVPSAANAGVTGGVSGKVTDLVLRDCFLTGCAGWGPWRGRAEGDPYVLPPMWFRMSTPANQTIDVLHNAAGTNAVLLQPLLH